MQPSTAVATIPPARRASDRARRRFRRLEGRPMLLADWQRAVFVHYALPAAQLQVDVPLPLDTRDGMAYVSLVAFTMRGLRLNRAGRAGRWLMTPGATHELLNVRTYVTHRGQPGIYFLKEWIPNRLSAFLGPRMYGLPYRLGQLAYRHDHERGVIAGTVMPRHDQGRLSYRATVAPDAAYRPAEAGSFAAFVLERYTAYTLRGRQRCRFRIWHPPWPVTPIDVRLEDDSALRGVAAWAEGARPVAAHYSPGVSDVWMGLPHTRQ